MAGDATQYDMQDQKNSKLGRRALFRVDTGIRAEGASPQPETNKLGRASGVFDARDRRAAQRLSFIRAVPAVRACA